MNQSGTVSLLWNICEIHTCTAVVVTIVTHEYQIGSLVGTSDYTGVTICIKILTKTHGNNHE